MKLKSELAKYSGTIFVFLFVVSSFSYSQDKEAKITLSFENRDSVNLCKAYVSSGDSAVKEVSVKLFVQGMFSQLQIGKDASTNEEGIANFYLAKDIRADKNGRITVIAKIEDDENYANTETKETIVWGIKKVIADSENSERAFWASRNRAPIYLIIIADLIIFGVWGTLVYVIIQVFKLKNINKQITTKQI
jgi:hypothetical protein